MTEISDHHEKENDLALICWRILELILNKRFEDAKSLIDSGREQFPATEEHRFLALAATLSERLGEIDKAVALIRLARHERPAFLPHLYRLSVMLMDADRWSEADAILAELITESVAQSDIYFLNEARFRRAICLAKLGRTEEARNVKAEIAAGTSVFIGDRLLDVSNLAD